MEQKPSQLKIRFGVVIGCVIAFALLMAARSEAETRLAKILLAAAAGGFMGIGLVFARKK